jgi:hypothetical protein
MTSNINPARETPNEPRNFINVNFAGMDEEQAAQYCKWAERNGFSIIHKEVKNAKVSFTAHLAQLTTIDLKWTIWDALTGFSHGDKKLAQFLYSCTVDIPLRLGYDLQPHEEVVGGRRRLFVFSRPASKLSASANPRMISVVMALGHKKDFNKLRSRYMEYLQRLEAKVKIYRSINRLARMDGVVVKDETTKIYRLFGESMLQGN